MPRSRRAGTGPGRALRSESRAAGLVRPGRRPTRSTRITPGLVVVLTHANGRRRSPRSGPHARASPAHGPVNPARRSLSAPGRIPATDRGPRMTNRAGAGPMGLRGPTTSPTATTRRRDGRRPSRATYVRCATTPIGVSSLSRSRSRSRGRSLSHGRWLNRAIPPIPVRRSGRARSGRVRSKTGLIGSRPVPGLSRLIAPVRRLVTAAHSPRHPHRGRQCLATRRISGVPAAVRVRGATTTGAIQGLRAATAAGRVRRTGRTGETRPSGIAPVLGPTGASTARPHRHRLITAQAGAQQAGTTSRRTPRCSLGRAFPTKAVRRAMALAEVRMAGRRWRRVRQRPVPGGRMAAAVRDGRTAAAGGGRKRARQRSRPLTTRTIGLPSRCR
jgi:hypothetical protein